ncbi:hypothetical protein [Roseateles toxinivorans]|uniref:Putative secreted protein with PEP-CTERM sorting signal n=1 Tax=Roseateles toxinivorans TaxID=270368 RepID=A0A4R6QU70_9BURK|nr:hypothetical protein [Roseateles toxinivorans]TDP74332.1 putative secreted protein with PEP-CTERM sorting signal [Roseateles toxinivorans]
MTTTLSTSLRLLTLAGFSSLCAQQAYALRAETALDFLSPLSAGSYSWIRPTSTVTFDSTPSVWSQAGGFDVIDNAGAATTTSYQSQARAVANYTQLSVQARIMVDNPMTAGSANLPYADANGIPIAGGVPMGYASRASASLGDIVTLGTSAGTAAASLRFELGIDGTLGVDFHGDQYSSVEGSLWQVNQYDSANWGATLAWDSQQSSFDPSTWLFTHGTKTIDRAVWSKPIPVVNGKADFSFELMAHAEVNFAQSYINGGSYEAWADLGSTLRLVRAHAFDAMGNEIGLDSLVGNSGTHYAVSSVPEPGSWQLLLLGVLPILLRQSRKRPMARL